MQQFDLERRQSRRTGAVSAHAETQAKMSFRAAATAWLVMALLIAFASQQATASAPAPRVDLNRANAEELETLPGIGASKAAAIVDFRTKSGAFKRVEDLEEVRGIGPALIAKIRPFVTIGSKPRVKSDSKSGPRTAAKAPAGK